MAAGAGRRDGVVAVDGLEFERNDRRGLVAYIAADGVRLRSIADVEKYLRKCGLVSSLPHCLKLFDFGAISDAGVGSVVRGQPEALSANDTPVKEDETSSPQKACGKRTVESNEGGEAEDGASRAKRASKAATDGLEPEPEGKKRNRDLAKSRAAAFAFGRGFVDDEGREPAKAAGGASSKKSKKEKGKATVGERAENAMEGERESWPGPWATASALYTKRDAAVEARKGTAPGAEKRVVLWKPAAGGQRAHSRTCQMIPSLQNMCIDIVSTHIDACLEFGLGSILPEMKAKICENLCKKRRLLPDVLPIFTDCETHTLSLPDCSYIGEVEMAEAFQRCQGPALEVLHLKYCGRSMSDKLLEDLCSKAANLHTLQLGGCYRVSDKGIGAAVKLLPHLRILELSDCRNISVEALRSVATLGDTLESLSLKNSTQLDSEALLQLAALRNLKRISLAGCRGASDVIVEMLVDACGSTLEELDISHLPDSGFTAEPNNCRITDTSLEALASKCAELRKLKLGNCDTITDRGILALSQGMCQQLSHLDLSRCKSLSDDGLKPLIMSCKMLSHMSLNSAGVVTVDEETGIQTHGITDETLIALRDHRSKTLEELDVSWCRGISDEGLGYLVDNAYHLKTLYLRGCGQITDIFLNGHSNSSIKVWGRSLHDSSLRRAPKGWCTE